MPTPPRNANDSSKFDFLNQGGELARLIAAKDWSQTPLGPIESWTQSLRTAVSLCLESTFPIDILWGKDATQIYNDSYRIVCAEAHPRSLGEAFQVTWASAWPAIGESFEKACRGEACYLENQRIFLKRNGYLEETFFTFSLSPIRDEQGEVVGLFHPVVETTAIMISLRRTALLRSLAEATTQAKTVKQACKLSIQTLSQSPLDIPFALVYLFDAHSGEAQFEEFFGLPKSCANKHSWPLNLVLDSGKPVEIDDLDQRLGAHTSVAYGDLLKRAILLPLRGAGREGPMGVLIVGISTRLPLDDSYRGFLDLLSLSISGALNDSHAREEEHRRAEALADLNRAKTAFFSNVSHEFRTPLTLMLGPLEENIANPEGVPPAHHKRDELAYRNSLRLLKLVNTLLEFSRIEAGKAQAQFRPTDLSRLTIELASVFRAAIEKAGLKFSVQADDLGGPVYVDRDMWEKIVLNLLSNAFKFTLQGEIEVRLERRGEQVLLTVRDSGCGIADSELPRIFERFHRIEGAVGRSFEGSGIGLALIQELVKFHGGSVQVTSKLGSGSKFEVLIPLGSSHLLETRVSQEAPEPVAGLLGAAFAEEALQWVPEAKTNLTTETDTAKKSTERRARILIADDNADMRSYLKGLLQTLCDVEAVSDGEAAWDAIQKQIPDLILSDVMMPKLDGFQLLNRLRSDPKTKDLQMILISAKADEESRIEGFQAGTDAYLIKPFSARELLARVASNLKLAESRQETELERQRLHDFFMQAPAPMVFLLGPDHRYFLANEPYEKMVGRKVLGQTVLQAFSQEEVANFTPLLDRVYQTGEPYIGNEVPLSIPDGQGVTTEHFINVRYYPFRERTGKIKGVLAIHQDVTELVTSRKIVEESARLLSLEQQKFEAMIANAPAGIALMRGPSFIFERINDRWREFVSPREYLGRSYEEVYPELVNTQLPQELARVYETGQPFVAVEMKVSVESKPAVFEDRYYNFSYIRIMDQERHRPDAKPYGIYCLGFDVTSGVLARQQIEKITVELSHTVTSLEAERELRERFVATLTHDLRTPLTAAKLNADLLARKAQDPEQVQILSDRIGFNMDRASQMISDLLDANLITVGEGIPLSLEECRIDQLFDSTVNNLTDIHGSRFEIKNEIGPLTGYWDRNAIQRVIENLAGNAVKYGKLHSPITLALTKGATWVDIAVHNEGNEISREDQKTLFDSYRRTESAKSGGKTGWGIGLTLVKGVAEAHGGTVRVESERDRGTTFTVRLPLGVRPLEKLTIG